MSFLINKLPNITTDINRISIISLKKAMYAYFSTYQALLKNINIRDSREEYNIYYSDKYYQDYTETIIYFNHFFEITIKYFLKQENIQIRNKATFKESLKELCDFGIYKNNSLKYVVDNKSSLNKLNELRNKILHKGNYIMNFEELDFFIGHDILPIVDCIFKMNDYDKLVDRWKYKTLNCNIDPINEIIKCCFNKGIKQVDYSEIALLKEMARASYDNPIPNKINFIYAMTKNNIVDSAQYKANLITKYPHDLINDLLDRCPVCGQKTLAEHRDSDYESEYDNINDITITTGYFEWIESVECTCCSFNLDYGFIKDTSKYGLNLRNFFVNI